MALPTRKLGPFAVSAIGLGCMNLSQAYSPIPSEAESTKLLVHALDAGVTFFDTAAIYGDGHNQRLLGGAIMHARDRFTLASKCVLDRIGEERVLDGRPAAIKATCEKALRDLRVEVIDLYYLHWLDRKVAIEESMGAMADLVREGKIRTIGLSEMSAATIERAHAIHPVTAVQSEYSLVVRNPEVAVLETCRRLGIGFVPFAPVARGLLSEGVTHDRFKKGDIRAFMPRFVGDRPAPNLDRIAAFNRLAREAGYSPTQLAIGWLLAQGDDLVPIPGTRSIAHLDEDIAAASIAFDPALIAAAGALFPPDALSGARCAASMQAQIDIKLLLDEELA